uniref:Uncharacterized protein n=1 Tax=Micrurus spixii TaxID=129469 RepID=A0A2D4MZ48_9SAUR
MTLTHTNKSIFFKLTNSTFELQFFFQEPKLCFFLSPGTIFPKYLSIYRQLLDICEPHLDTCSTIKQINHFVWSNVSRCLQSLNRRHLTLSRNYGWCQIWTKQMIC